MGQPGPGAILAASSKHFLRNDVSWGQEFFLWDYMEGGH